MIALEAYAADCRLFGFVDPGEGRLTDFLNATPELRIQDARLESLADGHIVQTPELMLARDELCAVVAGEPRGDASRRVRTHATRFVVDLGPYAITGFVHSTSASDPLGAVLRRAAWVPLTDVTITYRRGQDSVTDEVETLLVNRNLTSLFRAVEDRFPIPHARDIADIPQIPGLLDSRPEIDEEALALPQPGARDEGWQPRIGAAADAATAWSVEDVSPAPAPLPQPVVEATPRLLSRLGRKLRPAAQPSPTPVPDATPALWAPRPRSPRSDPATSSPSDDTARRPPPPSRPEPRPVPAATARDCRPPTGGAPRRRSPRIDPAGGDSPPARAPDRGSDPGPPPAAAHGREEATPAQPVEAVTAVAEDVTCHRLADRGDASRRGRRPERRQSRRTVARGRDPGASPPAPSRWSRGRPATPQHAGRRRCRRDVDRVPGGASREARRVVAARLDSHQAGATRGGPRSRQALAGQAQDPGESSIRAPAVGLLPVLRLGLAAPARGEPALPEMPSADHRQARRRAGGLPDRGRGCRCSIPSGNASPRPGGWRASGSVGSSSRPRPARRPIARRALLPRRFPRRSWMPPGRST